MSLHQWILCAVLVLTAIVVVFAAIGMRSQCLRGCLLQLLALCEGVKLQWVTEPNFAFHVLKSSDNKGQLIEAKLSLPAWYPVVSLESVSGAQWRKMKTQFTKLLQVLQPIANLTTLFETHGHELLKSNAIIDAHKLNELSIRCFYEWIFKRKFDSDKFGEVCLSTWEWRKEIALKGFADVGMKQRTIEWCVAEVRKTTDLFALFGDKWADLEYYSLILQPFIISPAINLTDIAVEIQEWVKTTPSWTRITPKIIRQCVSKAHPFPVVERFFPIGDAAMEIALNTHVLIPLDQIAEDAFKRGVDLTFGAGSRSCIGRHMAMKAMCAPTCFNRDSIIDILAVTMTERRQ
ncbi:hypothetical protein CCR75_000942 [Bremia lactucae]|uniref:Uncharacterized protein n=1 Tax=Bremia lactucae TaxID=4779 RepID=A0A976FM11_BRELC|nr:hypothetical protein CCR75_000942 [Bremia lactucae]